MTPVLFGATLIMAVLDWIAVWRNWRPGIIIAKPATLICLIAWYLLAGGWQGQMLWFGFGLVFSLAGDVVLLLPNSLLGGLAAFLAAHICYIIGFNPSLPPPSLFILPILIGVGVLAFTVMNVLLRGIRSNKQFGKFRIPVLVYGIVISLMLVSAWLTLLRPGWTFTAAALAALGGTLFFTSDSLLAYNLFVRPVRFGNVLVMVTYHLGQLALISGVLISARLLA